MTLTKPIVVVDSSAFMCLEKEPEHFGYFGQLFEQVLIPPEVAAELVSKTGETPEAYLAGYGLQELVEIVRLVPLEAFVALHKPPFDRGEAQVISLAAQRRLHAVIEERRGRNFANKHGVLASNMAAFAVRGFAGGYLARADAEAMVDTMHRVHMFGERHYTLLMSDIERVAQGKPL